MNWYYNEKVIFTQDEIVQILGLEALRRLGFYGQTKFVKLSHIVDVEIEVYNAKPEQAPPNLRIVK